MSDLIAILPNYVLAPQLQDIHASLEKHHVTTLDLLTLDASDVAKKIGVNLLELRRFSNVVNDALHEDMGFGGRQGEKEEGKVTRRRNGLEALKAQTLMSTGDPEVDGMLGGGLATGCITEIVGEAGAGKSNILLHLLLAVQLPTHVGGLDGAAIYLSTEGRPPTNRLAQLAHAFQDKYPDCNVSMDRILCNDVRDINILEHMVRYQLPFLIEKHNVRLVVIDSIAAPFRAEASAGGKSLRDPALLAKRSRQLVVLGQLLRDLAIKHDLVVLAANQVSDKFSRNETINNNAGSSSQPGTQSNSQSNASEDDVMMLDYQARWFTGWEQAEGGKVPALGMSWTNVLAARIALFRRTVETLDEENEIVESTKRFMKVVFAPWVRSRIEREFVIETAGIRGLPLVKKG